MVPRIDPGSVGYERVTASALPSSADVCLARPKSRILMRSSAGDEDVLRLEVAMDDAVRVRGRQAVGDEGRDLDGLLPRQPPACQPPPERLALQELGDQVPDAVVGPDVVDREDVRVGQRGDGARLALKPRERVGSPARLAAMVLTATSRPAAGRGPDTPRPCRPRPATTGSGRDRETCPFDAHAPRRLSLFPPTEDVAVASRLKGETKCSP